MSKVQWGILGTGRMASAFAKEFMFAADAELAAVGSRAQQSASLFAADHNVPRAFPSYADLLDDDELDVIYIATPHPMHRDLALAAIERGKAVVVEKSFTATFEGAKQVVEAARRAGVFCMEGMWTRFLPAVRAAREIVAWGRIGDVLGVTGDLCAPRQFDPSDRLFSQELGGGALLDLGVYPVSFAQAFLGASLDVHCAARLAPNGVDAAAAMTVTYATGATASLNCGFDLHGPGRMVILGTRGWIEVHPRFHHPSTISLHRDGHMPKVIEAKFTGQGYVHEIDEVSACVKEGLTESPLMTLDDTLEVMRVLQACVEQAGVEYREASVDLTYGETT